MKAPAPSHLFVLRILLPALFLSMPALAVPSENGAWQISGLEIPVRFHETFYNHTTMTSREGANADAQPGPDEWLVDSRFSSVFGVDQLSITLNDGTISGDEAGSYTPGRYGRVHLNLPGGNPAAYINTSRDIMLVSAGDPDYQKAHVATRLPTAIKVADLAGSWHVLITTVPEDLTATNCCPSTPRARPADPSTAA
jgi:hypothetical protein